MEKEYIEGIPETTVEPAEDVGGGDILPGKMLVRVLHEVVTDPCDELQEKCTIIVPEDYNLDTIYAIAIFEMAKERVSSNLANTAPMTESLDHIIVSTFSCRHRLTMEETRDLMKDKDIVYIPIGFESCEWYDNTYQLRSPGNYNCYAVDHTDPAGKMWSKYAHILSKRYPWFMVEFADIIAALDPAKGTGYVDVGALSNFIGLRKRNAVPKSAGSGALVTTPRYQVQNIRNNYRAVVRKLWDVIEADQSCQATSESNILANMVEDTITLLKTAIDLWLKPIPSDSVFITQEYVMRPNFARRKVTLVFTPPGSFRESDLISILKLAQFTSDAGTDFYWIVDLGVYALIMRCFISKRNIEGGHTEYMLNYYDMTTVINSPFALFSSGTFVARIADSNMDTVLNFIRWIDAPTKYMRGESYEDRITKIPSNEDREAMHETNTKVEESEKRSGLGEGELTADEKEFEKIMNMSIKEIMYEMFKIQKTDE